MGNIKALVLFATFLGLSEVNAEPVNIANQFIADSSQISVKIHGLQGEGYLVDVVSPIIAINYGCPRNVSENDAKSLLAEIAEAIDDQYLHMVKEFKCNERRRGR